MPALPELIGARCARDAPHRERAAGGAPLVVAGLGSIGSRHLRNLSALGVRDPVLLRHDPWAEPGAESLRVACGFEAALVHRPRAVLVCNPTALHMPLALAAARAGCHLFLEKPISHTLDGVAELQDEVSRRGLIVLVGFQYRFHPTLRRIKAWIEEGALGEIASARARWGEYLPGWHPGEDYRQGYSARRELGGGVVLTLSHPFDYLRWLLGEVVSVAAFHGQRGGFGLDVEDTAQVLLRFTSGTLASVGLDYVARPRQHALEIVGTRGSASWNEAEGVARLHDARRGVTHDVLPPEGFSRDAMFRAEMAHFLDCLEGAATPQCSLTDGVRALRIALAARRAAEAGREIPV